MKLYATTTSERASKGQGGNDQLEIDIFVYDRMNPRYHITVTKDEFIVTERGYNQERMFASHKDIREQEEKGEKKKDECSRCKQANHKEKTECRYYGSGVGGMDI